VTAPPNQRTSPYAIRMIVRFLKMLIVSFILCRECQGIRVDGNGEELLFVSIYRAQ
jgi:hypothetical protein